MKKLIAILMVLFVSLGLIAGCGGSVDSGDEPTASQGGANEGALSKDDVVFVNNGESVYTIVRPENGEFGEDVLASELFKNMRSALGIKLKNTDDTGDGTDKYEILIGPTNRPESKQAIKYMVSVGRGRYNDYIICSIGKKIVINAHTAEALQSACEYFCQNYLKGTTVTGGIEYICAPEGEYSDITINGTHISKFTIIRPHLNSSYLQHLETEKVIEDIKSVTGYKLYLLDDEYTEPDDYEIIIGNCDRDGVETTDDTDKFSILIKGNKVYLNGGSPHATGMAVSEFGKLLKKGSVTDADSVTGSYKSAIASYDKKTTYTPTWYDTFDGDVLDTSKWRLMDKGEFGRDGQNGKRSLMSDDPEYVYQKDGKFYINAQEKEDAYYGGCILNDNIMVFRYGYVEMSALCPDGPGFWSLIYFYQPDDSNAGPFTGANQGYYRPEIDLNECFGNGRMTYFNCHAHVNVKGKLAGKEHISFDNSPYKNDRIYHCPDGKTFSDNFHTYGLIWDETQMTMVADGKVHFKYEFSTEYDIDAFVETYLCMKIGFSVARENNNLDINQVTEEQWENSSTMIVDYVYLYQFDDSIQDIIYLK
ncbi:MAG: family 16 glycosylhydrolase [Clostridia bacterium]|nr:family 16 glycosylhydrolase [Clostridia bacterium]